MSVLKNNLTVVLVTFKSKEVIDKCIKSINNNLPIIVVENSNDKYFEKIEDLSGISKNHPILSLCFLITLFSLAGIPPLAGFFAKFYIFLAVIEKQMYFLAIIGLLSTVIAAFYYLRIIKIMYFDDAKQKYDVDHHLGLKLSLIISTIIILLYFMYPGSLVEIINKINLI